MEPAEVQALHANLGALPVIHGEGAEDVSLTAVYLCSAPAERANQLLSHVDPLHKARLSNDMTRLQCRYSRDDSASNSHRSASNAPSPTKPTPLTALNVRSLNMEFDRPSLSDNLVSNHQAKSAQDPESIASHQTSVRKVVEWNDNPKVHTLPDLATAPALSMEERAAKLAALSVMNAQAQALLRQLSSVKANTTGLYVDPANTTSATMTASRCTVSPVVLSQLNTQLAQLKQQLCAVSANQLPQKSACTEFVTGQSQPQPACTDAAAQQQLKSLQAQATALLCKMIDLPARPVQATQATAGAIRSQHMDMPASDPVTTPVSDAIQTAMQQLAQLKAKAAARHNSSLHTPFQQPATNAVQPSHLEATQTWPGSINATPTATEATNAPFAVDVQDGGVGIAKLRSQAAQLLAKAAATKAMAGSSFCVPVTGTAKQSIAHQSSEAALNAPPASARTLFVTAVQQVHSSPQPRPWTVADI